MCHVSLICRQSPLKWDPRDPLPNMQFDITVRLPRHSNVAPLKIAAFESNLPEFSHHLRDLGDHVLFESLKLQSTNAHISSQVSHILLIPRIVS